MYEELVSHLRECAKLDPSENTFAEAADAIEDLSKTLDEEVEINTALECNMPVWIPVTERLPESGVHVLLACKCGSGSYVCDGFHTEKFSLETAVWDDVDADYCEETDEYYFPEGWWEVIKNWDDYSSVAIEDKVTHWMQLPEPTKDGAE